MGELRLIERDPIIPLNVRTVDMLVAQILKQGENRVLVTFLVKDAHIIKSCLSILYHLSLLVLCCQIMIYAIVEGDYVVKGRKNSGDSFLFVQRRNRYLKC